jgi:hypothetical protein
VRVLERGDSEARSDKSSTVYVSAAGRGDCVGDVVVGNDIRIDHRCDMQNRSSKAPAVLLSGGIVVGDRSPFGGACRLSVTRQVGRKRLRIVVLPFPLPHTPIR